MDHTDNANILRCRALNAKRHLSPNEEGLLSSLHETLAERFRCFMPHVSEIILAYRGILGDPDEALDGDACENLAAIIGILINDHEGHAISKHSRDGVTDEMICLARRRWPDVSDFDFVECTNPECSFVGLVPIGEKACPDCRLDSLQWADEDCKELSV